MSQDQYRKAQASTCRVSCYDDPGSAAPVFLDILHHPGHGCRSIPDAIGRLDFGSKPIVHGHNGEFLIFQRSRDLLMACGQAAAMKPDDRGEILHVGRIIEVQFAAFPLIIIARIGDITDIGFRLIVLRSSPKETQQRERNQ